MAGRHGEDRSEAQRRANTLKGVQDATRRGGQQSGPASDSEAQRRAKTLKGAQDATRHKR